MKKIVSGLLMGLFFVGCTEQETTYTIQGEWEGGDGKVETRNMKYWIPLLW